MKHLGYSLVIEMQIEEFVKKLKDTKGIAKDTALLKVKVMTNKEHTSQRIYSESKCSQCGHTTTIIVFILFSKEQKLSVFQAGLLFSLYVLNKKPNDYANYHKCIAGKEFIENIKSIEVF